MDSYDLSALGGGIILGSRKLIMKARGNSNEQSIMNISRMVLNHAKGAAVFANKEQ